MKELLLSLMHPQLTIDSQVSLFNNHLIEEIARDVGLDPSQMFHSVSEQQRLALQAQMQANAQYNQNQLSAQNVNQNLLNQNNAYEQAQKNINQHYRAQKLLIERLIGLSDERHEIFTKDNFITCYVKKGTVYTFFVLSERAGVVEEDVNIFPSDKLISQLRMVLIA